MPGQTAAKSGGSVSLPIVVGKAMANPTYRWDGTPASQNPTDLPSIDALQDAGVTKEEKLARINQLEAQYVQRFKDTFHAAMTDKERVDSHYREDFKALADGKALTIPNSMFRPNGPDGPLVNPYNRKEPVQPLAESEAAAKAARSGVVLPTSGAIPQRVGTYQPPMANSMQDVNKILASHKSGTHFQYKTPSGKVFDYEVQ